MKAVWFPIVLVWEFGWKQMCKKLAKRKYSARDVKADFNKCLQTAQQPRAGIRREITIEKDTFTI